MDPITYIRRICLLAVCAVSAACKYRFQRKMASATLVIELFARSRPVNTGPRWCRVWWIGYSASIFPKSEAEAKKDRSSDRTCISPSAWYTFYAHHCPTGNPENKSLWKYRLTIARYGESLPKQLEIVSRISLLPKQNIDHGDMTWSITCRCRSCLRFLRCLRCLRSNWPSRYTWCVAVWWV